MKELSIFRIFILFPFIGVVFPDVATKLHNLSASITPEHVIVAICLSLSLLISTVGIWRQEVQKEIDAAI